MVRVDIDVGYATHTVGAPKMLDGDAAVIENTKSSGPGSCGVMQAGDRYEGTTASASHDPVGGGERRADHCAGGLEYPAIIGCIAAVQKTGTGLRALHDVVHVLGSMKKLQLRAGGI